MIARGNRANRDVVPTHYTAVVGGVVRLGGVAAAYERSLDRAAT